ETCEPFFFFQAEDGIRDFHVTGVQTCALPIWFRQARLLAEVSEAAVRIPHEHAASVRADPQTAVPAEEQGADLFVGETFRFPVRSEERRVGKEWRHRRAPWPPEAWKATGNGRA